jgi:hypothetical protein
LTLASAAAAAAVHVLLFAASVLETTFVRKKGKSLNPHARVATQGMFK